MELNDILKQHLDAVEKQVGALDPDIRKALEQTKILDLRMLDVEQKLVRGFSHGGLDGGTSQSWGQQFIEADGLKALAENTSHPGRFRMEMKAIIGSGPTSGGPFVIPAADQPASMPQRRLQVRDLLPVITISSGSVQFAKQSTRTSAAAPVAEGGLKPESAYAFTLETAPVRTIAHWTQASRQILDDAPQLAGLIDVELRYGLALAEENQLVNGDGTGENLDGLIANSTPYAPPFTPNGTPNEIDKIGLAILQTALTDFVPSGIIVHPSDFMKMRLTKDSQGRYIMGDPGVVAPPVLFGLPVSATPAIAVDKFLVGDFTKATIYDRMTPRVEASTEDGDNFRKNLVTLLAEERIAFAVKNALAFTYGDFGNVALVAATGRK